MRWFWEWWEFIVGQLFCWHNFIDPFFVHRNVRVNACGKVNLKTNSLKCLHMRSEVNRCLEWVSVPGKLGKPQSFPNETTPVSSRAAPHVKRPPESPYILKWEEIFIETTFELNKNLVVHTSQASWPPRKRNWNKIRRWNLELFLVLLKRQFSFFGLDSEFLYRKK